MVHRNGTSDLGVAQERENEQSSLLRNEVKYVGLTKKSFTPSIW
jgi:hypothetical protein